MNTPIPVLIAQLTVCDDDDSGDGSGDDETTTESGVSAMMASFTLATGLAVVSSLMRTLTH